MERNSTNFRCTGPASTVSYFLGVPVALRANPGGVLSTQCTDLHFSSRVYLADNYSNRILFHDYIHVTASHIAGLNMLIDSHFDSLIERVTSMLPLFIHGCEYGVSFVLIILSVMFVYLLTCHHGAY